MDERQRGRFYGQFLRRIGRSYRNLALTQKDVENPLPTFESKESYVWLAGLMRYRGGLHQSSQALSAAPSPLMFNEAIMNLYLSSMFIGLGPFNESLDSATRASL